MWVEVVGDQPLPELPPQVILSAIAEREGVESDDQFKALLEGNPALRAEVEALLALTQIATLDPEAMAAIQAVEPMLLEWIQTPDWDASQLFLAEHQGTLLTDVGEKALDLLVRANPHNELLTVHLALLRRCRQLGVDAAFEEFHAARQDPLGRALAALFAVHSPEALAQTLADHPALGELPAVERVAALVHQSHDAGSDAATVRLLYFAAVLAERYLYSHAEGIVAADQEAFIATLEGLIFHRRQPSNRGRGRGSSGFGARVAFRRRPCLQYPRQPLQRPRQGLRGGDRCLHPGRWVRPGQRHAAAEPRRIAHRVGRLRCRRSGYRCRDRDGARRTASRRAER